VNSRALANSFTWFFGFVSSVKTMRSKARDVKRKIDGLQRV
jgi:hypothetical protein